MENKAFYNNLLITIKDDLNDQEIKELGSFQKENIPLLEKKIQKAKSSIKFVRIAMFIILSLIFLFAFLFEYNAVPKLNHFLFSLLMVFPIAISNTLIGKNSLPTLQKKIDTFELMLLLTKNR